MKKRSIVLNDKAKIAKVIAEMDKKKNEALQKAYEQVNKVGSLYGLSFHFTSKISEIHIFHCAPSKCMKST